MLAQKCSNTPDPLQQPWSLGLAWKVINHWHWKYNCKEKKKKKKVCDALNKCAAEMTP